MPSKNTPVKDTPKKGEQVPAKKILTPDKSTEPPVKKQWTGSPSSDWESKTNHDRAEKSKKKKKKKKKDPKSEPIVATDSEAEETEERQEKHQRAWKWKEELKELQDYRESHNIFLHNLPEWGGGSHTGYLESRTLDTGAGFFIKTFKAWWVELQKQSQGIRHSVISVHCKLQMLERMHGVKLSTQYNMHTEYLVEIFKYPGTGNRIPTDTADGYGSTPMIGLYGLIEPYSIARITTTQSRVVGKDRKKKLTSKCYCSLCDYVVQNHPSINNHFHTHLRLTLLCTINRCSTLNTAAMTCGFMLPGSTIYPPDMWQYHHPRGPKTRSESPIERQWHSASELNVFPRSAWWMPFSDVPYSSSYF